MAKSMQKRGFHQFRSFLGLLITCSAVFACGTSQQPDSEPQVAPSQPRQESRAAANRYDLSRDEQRGGHTLERHVARTDQQLGERLEHERHISAASTWTDRDTAETVVAEALLAEHGRVENWMHRGYPRANLAVHYNAGQVIGRSLRRGDAATVNCTSAVIVLRADGPQSFYVLTTYPEARE